MAMAGESSNPDTKDPAQDGFSITPNDTATFTNNTRGIYIGVGGDVSVKMVGGENILFKAVPQGVVLPVRAQQVFNFGTAASNLVGLY
jgi:hypothetical protein